MQNRGGIPIPEELFLLLQRVEHVDGGGLLQAVGLEGRQHVDELQEDLADVHGQQVVVTLGVGADSRQGLSGVTVTRTSRLCVTVRRQSATVKVGQNLRTSLDGAGHFTIKEYELQIVLGLFSNRVEYLLNNFLKKKKKPCGIKKKKSNFTILTDSCSLDKESKN